MPTEVIDSVLDYPTWFTLTSAFAASNGSLSALTDRVTATQKAYKGGAFASGSFLENHDQPRFQSLTKDQAVGGCASQCMNAPECGLVQLVKNAMTWPFIHDGIPITYYGSSHLVAAHDVHLHKPAGQEQGYTGGADPENREA